MDEEILNIIRNNLPANGEINTDNITVLEDSNENNSSPELEDLLERAPSRMMRWGIFCFIIVFAIVVGIAALVKYPDTLEGAAFVTTNPLPVKIKTLAGGRILQIFSKENQHIEKGFVLAEMENNIGLKNIISLNSFCDHASAAVKSKNYDALSILNNHELNSLGEAQNYYNKILESIHSLLLMNRKKIYQKRIGVLETQTDNYKNLSSIANQNKDLVNEQLQKNNEILNAQKQLFTDKVISKKEYYEAYAQYSQNKQALENQKSAKVQSSISENENRKQLYELEFEKTERENTLLINIEEQVRNLKNFIESWKLKYLLTSPFTGVVHELRPLQANDMLNPDEDVYMITPATYTYIATAYIPAANFGKIEEGQQAHILLDRYPYNEYGYLEGKVSFFSSTTQANETAAQKGNNADQYRVYIQLNNDLSTSYHRKIKFAPEMSGTVRIITENKSLLQRLFETASKINK